MHTTKVIVKILKSVRISLYTDSKIYTVNDKFLKFNNTSSPQKNPSICEFEWDVTEGPPKIDTVNIHSERIVHILVDEM